MAEHNEVRIAAKILVEYLLVLSGAIHVTQEKNDKAWTVQRYVSMNSLFVNEDGQM